MSMEINEVREMRRTLEKDIINLVQQFQEDTTTTVTSIEVGNVEQIINRVGKRTILQSLVVHFDI